MSTYILCNGVFLGDVWYIMNTMPNNNLSIIRKAIDAVSKEVAQYNDEALRSVLAQLRYVEGILNKTETDMSKLSRLAIGVTTVKLLADEYPHLVGILLDADRISKKLH